MAGMANDKAPVEVAAPEATTRSIRQRTYWADSAHRAVHSARMKKIWGDSEKAVALARKRSIRIQDQNGTEYESVNDAARRLNLHASNIRAHLRGRVSHVKGFTFKPVNRPDGH